MIDTPILSYAETNSNIFIFAILESIFNRIVWNTIDDRFSNFVLPLYRNEATFLDFRLFRKIFSMAVWTTVDDTYSVFYIVTKSFSI